MLPLPFLHLLLERLVPVDCNDYGACHVEDQGCQR